MFVTCGQCNKKLKLNDALAGKKVKCPSCGSVVAVPEETAVVEAAAEAAKALAVSSVKAAPPPTPRPAPEEPQPAKKSNVGLLIGLGCGALALVGLMLVGGAGAAWWFWLRDGSTKTGAPVAQNNTAGGDQGTKDTGPDSGGDGKDKNPVTK